MIRNAKPARLFIGKLAHGDDLLESLNRHCAQNNIRCGKVSAIGAVQKGRVGFYDQGTKTYGYLDFSEGMEILSLMGNISIKDGAPFVHAHVTFGKESGEVVGGHLFPGNIVFAMEFIIEEFLADDLVRGLDETTGLPLWKND